MGREHHEHLHGDYQRKGCPVGGGLKHLGQDQKQDQREHHPTNGSQQRPRHEHRVQIAIGNTTGSLAEGSGGNAGDTGGHARDTSGDMALGATIRTTRAEATSGVGSVETLFSYLYASSNGAACNCNCNDCLFHAKYVPALLVFLPSSSRKDLVVLVGTIPGSVLGL